MKIRLDGLDVPVILRTLHFARRKMTIRLQTLLAVILAWTGLAPVRAQDVYLSAGESVNLPVARKQTLRFSPRYGSLGAFDFTNVEPGVQRLVYTGGLIINVTYEVMTPKGPVPQEYEFAADNLVLWIHGMKGLDMLNGAPVGPDQKTRVELYMAGSVVVRNKDETFGAGGKPTVVTRTMRADQVYYDVEKNKAVALKADLEMKFDNYADSVHLYGERIERRSRGEWNATRAGAFSSKLPSDPALRLRTADATLTETDTEHTNIFGIPYRNILTGERDTGPVRMLESRNTRVDLLGVPIFYTPYYNADISEPIGPLRGLGFGNDRIFGAQFYTTWDMYKLLALRGPPNHKWQLDADYLSDRGPAIGSEYDYMNQDLFGYFGPNRGLIRGYYINDGGTDILGGYRGIQAVNPRNRGRAQWLHQQDLLVDHSDDGLYYDRFLRFQGQFAYLSDQNFFEQYYKQEFDTGINQETFAYFSGSRGQFYGSLLAQGGVQRDWITETQWLPNLRGAVVGQSFWDIFQYEARGGAAYARLRPSEVNPLPYVPTDLRTDTGRFDLMQELSVPFDLGPTRFVPYGLVDLAYYSNDLTGNDTGRIYGGGGLRASTTLSRLYRDVNSELFNLRGLNHKSTYWMNYANLLSNTPYTQLPQLDRLNDDTNDYGMRTMQPYFPLYIPGMDGLALQTAPQFDLQKYAIRRLVMNRVDTRDDLQVVQAGVNNRLQTKRGMPGREHTVDWMSLNLSASFFPDPGRDNFGHTASLLEFDYLWNVGDQTALTASGWFDPFDPGARYWTIGGHIQRPNGVNFYAGYRQTDPLNSKTVTLSTLYTLSKKYSVNVAASYDFGTQLALSNNVTIFRTGTDLTVGLGFSYNALVNNFGVNFVVIPNLAAAAGFGRAGTPMAMQ